MAINPQIAAAQARARAQARAQAQARAKARADAEARAKALAEERGRAVAEERATIGVFQPESAVATAQNPPVITQTGDAIGPAPVLQRVQPGDLITAQYINNIVAAVQNLQLRVDLLEELIHEGDDS